MGFDFASKIKEIESHYQGIEALLSQPDVVKDIARYQRYLKDLKKIEPIVKTYKRLESIKREMEESQMLLNDPEQDICNLAREEMDRLKAEEEVLSHQLKVMLLPKDPNDDKNILLEIRAGTGGEEAALFAQDLFRMYTRYAERRGWSTEILSSNETGLGGFKEVILLVAGEGAYSRLKYEAGVHRVQRVPETESQGRIHTSAVTVAILPEAEEVDVDIKPEELRIDIFRASGHGGQHVNTTDSAVRITHLPTGIVVTCQDERSQHKNKAKAMKVLRSRLLELMQREQQNKVSQERRQMVGSGDRSERIRTYNFPQGRVTDHRIGLTLYQLEEVLQGELDLILDPLITYFQTEAIKNLSMN